MKSGILRAILLVVAAGVLPLAIGCNSSSTSTSVTTGPTSSKCGLTLSGPSSVSSSGGTSSVTVAAQPECGWTASTQAGWISDLSPASGQGNGKFDFRAAPNPVNSQREAEIIVNDTRVRIAQDAAPCHFALSPEGDTIPAAGSTGTISVTGPAGCAWTAVPSTTWINIDSGASGNGNGTVTYRVGPNNSSSGRNGSIAIGDRSFSVMQAAVTGPPGPPPSCNVTLSSTSQNIGAGGGAGSPITVTAAGCSWMAQSNVSWITVTSGASGNGPGTVRFTVDANTGAARTGTIAIGGQTFTVMQAAGTTSCNYGINPSSASPGAGASSGTVNVTAGNGCGWNAGSNASWLSITSGANGSGNGSVGYSVAANSGAARSGTLTIAGETFTVSQAAGTTPCSYGINPTSASPGAGASSGTVNVTAGNGCGWNAGSNASWLSITSGANGSGNGSVGYSVAANSGAARSGTLTIAGQTFTVSQAAGQTCSYTVNPTSFNVNQDRNDRTITVTAGSGCAWTAVSNAGFIDVRSGDSGSGNGTVSIRIASFNGNGSRTGTLTVAGHTVTVTQTR